MELAITVLCWTLTASVALTSIMLMSYLAAATEHARARTSSEKRLH